MSNTGPTLREIPARTLRRRRKALVAKLPPLESLLRGSLIQRYKRCGYAGCKCQRGRGHGPKYYLSIGQKGKRPRMDYVPQADQPQAQKYLENYRQVQQILKQICDINCELLRRREDL
jgi:hypothetical protein